MTLGEFAAAAALLTPLVLGLAALAKDIFFRKDKDKKTEPSEQSEEIVQGMTIPTDYAGELITELRREIREDRADFALQLGEKDREIERLRAELAAYHRIHQR